MLAMSFVCSRSFGPSRFLIWGETQENPISDETGLGWNSSLNAAHISLRAAGESMNLFDLKLAEHGIRLARGPIQTLQVNVGRKCNQSCHHCHVEAAPWRTEMLDELTALKIGTWITENRPKTVDITGGAPELSEYFCYLVETARAAGCEVIDRNNLTIIETEKFAFLPEYLASHQVQIVASLPCYSRENVDLQRGNGVFDKSISALRKLNAHGYGTRLPLTLVYNPVGPKIPGPQAELEKDYKAVLLDEFGIRFTSLFTITNQPIGRFAEELRQQGRWDAYLELLANSFNPETVPELMCRSTLSVGYRGELYDCDFNQMLGLGLETGGAHGVTRPTDRTLAGRNSLFLWDVSPEDLDGAPIRTGIHCLACTAGAGSSCGGALKVESAFVGK